MNTVTKQHYLFRFNQAAEDRVRKNAERYGIEVIAPRVTTWRYGKRGSKPKPVSVPAFHSYLILGFEHNQIVHALTDLHHSVRPVMMTTPEGELALGRIPTNQIQSIRDNRLFKGASAGSLINNVVVPDPKYTEKELVKILGGAATGLVGRIVAADPEAREAELDMDNWRVKLRVSYDLIERVA